VIENLMSKLGYLSQRQGLSWRPELLRVAHSSPVSIGQQELQEQASLGE